MLSPVEKIGAKKKAEVKFLPESKLVAVERFELSLLSESDFESLVSTVPPHSLSLQS